jgi:hypothetical protein
VKDQGMNYRKMELSTILAMWIANILKCIMAPARPILSAIRREITTNFYLLECDDTGCHRTHQRRVKLIQEYRHSKFSGDNRPFGVVTMYYEKGGFGQVGELCPDWNNHSGSSTDGVGITSPVAAGQWVLGTNQTLTQDSYSYAEIDAIVAAEPQ